MIDFACVQKELQECSREKDSSGIRVSPKSDNLARLTGIILGPLGTPYEGGSFEIDITLPGIPGDRRCMFRSVAHRACLRSGKSAPSEQAQRELADDLRAKMNSSNEEKKRNEDVTPISTDGTRRKGGRRGRRL
ncbi:hypothetical protein J1N35_023194 [Gossypium stocksii]|uniref:UBC core domain-containing protein n=1 Tax=Gossypium stocksii TaxID=47602 RepID=A0A9D3VIC4_9ROSI|nr:hypothetical protein J1N35_023194 [Gossypium stocksii]